MSAVRPGLTQRFAAAGAAWRDAHLYSLASSLGRLGSRPLGNVLTLGVMALALALPLCLTLLLGDLEKLSGSLRDSREIAVFLKPGADEAAAAALAETWRADPRVAGVELRSPAQGLAELRSMRDLDEALAALDANPLPWVLVFTPVAGSDDAALAAALGELPLADFVQHDAQWRERLAAWLDLGRRLAAVVAALLGLGVLLVVGNTVRLEIQGRADEIAIQRLLGATDGFVRRPFLYYGLCQGLLAGLLALGVAALARQALQPAVGALVASYGGEFSLALPGLAQVAGVLLGGAALGWAGAFLAVGQHLRRAEAQA